MYNEELFPELDEMITIAKTFLRVLPACDVVIELDLYLVEMEAMAFRIKHGMHISQQVLEDVRAKGKRMEEFVEGVRKGLLEKKKDESKS